MVRTQFDEVLSYGWNAGGNLGTGTKRAYQLVPTAVDVLRGEPITCAAAGARHSVAVSNTTLTGFVFDCKGRHTMCGLLLEACLLMAECGFPLRACISLVCTVLSLQVLTKVRCYALCLWAIL
jgi:Regulator of chromosome condensation (RCC1) repeat